MGPSVTDFKSDFKLRLFSVILLQIVMVSPGTHLSKILIPSPEPLSPSSKNSESLTEFFGPLCNHSDN